MRYVGRLIEWNDQKGYGFVMPNGGGDRAFVHISAFAGRRPTDGDLLSYGVRRDPRGRLNAIQVRHAVTRPLSPPSAITTLPRKAIATLAAGVIVAGWAFGKLPPVVPLLYGLMSAIAFLAYRLDKSAAMHGRWRTQETTLHMFGLAGGWPGALLAQDLFRHKSSKTSFQALFWLTVLLNCAGLAWAVSSGHAAALNRVLIGA